MANDPAPRLVVVVDDEKPTRDALGRLLSAGGFEPALFDGAEAFLATPSIGVPLCLIIDVHLGGMSGLDLQRHLRVTGSTVPIIVTSGEREPSLSRHAMEAGCAALLWKPFTAEALLEVIHSLPLLRHS